MSVCSATFEVAYDTTFTDKTFYLLKATKAPLLTFTDTNGNVELRNNQTGLVSSLQLSGTSYTDVYDLEDTLQLAFSDDGFTWGAKDDKLTVQADFPFTLLALTASEALGFSDAPGSDKAGVLSPVVTDSFSQLIDFYPPSTVSGENVFLRLVSATVNTHDLRLPITTCIPFAVSILNLPQPCGTTSKYNVECTRSQQVGLVVTNQTVAPGPRILTYLPDGHQQLLFRIDQITSGLETNINAGMRFVLMFEIEVSTG